MLPAALLATLTGLCAVLASPDSEIYLALRNDGQAGTGTAADPFDASSAAAFDACLARLGPNSAVHLGPGTFHTRGEAAFTLKANTKIRGAGMEVTRIVQDGTGRPHATVFQGGGGGIEIQDLSIDCGFENQRRVNGIIKCNAAAIGLYGSHLAVRRCRVFNYGSPYDNETGENFAVGIFQGPQADGKDLVIEDCVFTGQSELAPPGCSVLTISGGPLKSDINAPSWARGAVARRNVFLGYHLGSHGITMSGCQGAVVEDNYFEHFMGCAIYTDTWPLRDHIYRHNIMTDVNQGIFLAADTWDLVDFQIRDNVMLLHNGYDIKRIEKGLVTTDIEHSLAVGKLIQFRDLTITGGTVKNQQAVFVTSVPSRTTFTYATTENGPSDPADSATGGFIQALRYGCTTPSPEGINVFSGNGAQRHALQNFIIAGNVIRPYSSDGKARIPSTSIRICGAENSQVVDNVVFDSGNGRGVVVGSGKWGRATVICRDNYNGDNTPAVARDDRGQVYGVGDR
jgi:hypothetical protein